MNLKLLLFTFVSLAIIRIEEAQSDAPELTEATTVNQETRSAIVASSIPYARIRAAMRTSDKTDYIPSVLSFFSPDGGASYYSLGSDLKIRLVRFEDRTQIGSWTLTRWTHETQDSEVSAIYNMEGAQEGDVWHLYAHERLRRTESLGCLANTPLRYGDIEGDGTDSLALYLGKNHQQLDWVLFSPESGEIEFSARLALQDFMAAPEQAEVQYMSDALGHLGAMPGRRAYAKVYIEDFDGDESADIVVWRKRFESLPSEDENQGFELVDEVYRHYKKVGRQYQPQDTEEDVIQGWLAENELTWQKGYPSQSECEGEEGELIPEMHDPLLNDPDVLQ